MLPKLMCAALLVLGSSICKAAEPPHKDNAAAVIATLRQNKDVCESLVLQAKSDSRSRDMAEGMALYSDAMSQ
jgi:hypothetical protein